MQMAPAEEPAPATEEEKAPGFGFVVSRAQIKNGEVEFIDKSPDAMSARIHDINLVNLRIEAIVHE